MRKNKELWLVSELFYPETISTGYIITEIARSLSLKYDVNVVAGPEYYQAKNRKFESEMLGDVRIYRVNTNGYNKNVLTTRLIGQFLVSFKMILLMLQRIPRNSHVVIVTNPTLLFIMSSYLVKLRKWKIKLLVHDVFPENLIAAGLLSSKSSPLYRFLKLVFNNAFLKMETLIVLGRDMKNVFEKKIGLETRIAIVENWADLDNIHFVYNKSNTRKFLYAGNLGRVQGIETLLNVLSETRSEEFEFLFLGDGALDSYVKNYIESNDLRNIKKVGWLPRSAQNEFLAQSTIGVVSLTDGMYGLGVPSKFYNLLAAGKPIFYIGDRNSEVHLIMQEHEIGWYAEAGNQSMIQRVFLEIIKCDENILTRYSMNARNLAKNSYSKKSILIKWNSLFDK
mgnify:CR=1 FL=1